MLRDAILFTIDDVVKYVVLGFGERCEEALENTLFPQSGHIFHRDQFGRNFLDEPRKMKQ